MIKLGIVALMANSGANSSPSLINSIRCEPWSQIANGAHSGRRGPWTIWTRRSPSFWFKARALINTVALRCEEGAKSIGTAYALIYKGYFRTLGI